MIILNELLFYAGLVLTVLFFLLSLFLFYSQRIPTAVRYFLNVGEFKNNKKRNIEKTIAYKEREDNRTRIVTIANEEATYVLSDEETQLLSIAQNYATALIEAECTTYLEKPQGDFENNYMKIK